MRWIMVFSVCLLGLAACGNRNQGPRLGTALLGAAQRVTGLGASAEPAGPVPTAEQFIAGFPAAIVILFPRRGNAQAFLGQVRATAGAVTWLSSDGASVITKSGLVSGTRGIGASLMSADVSGVHSALAAGGGKAQRSMWFLDGLDQSVRQDFTCQITPLGAETIHIFQTRHATRKYLETCDGARGRFTNLYWIANGVVWQSSQWLSPDVGNITIARVK